MSRPGRRGTLKKPKLNMHPAHRKRTCPVCSKKFQTRPGFKKHLEAAMARLNPDGGNRESVG